MAEAPDFRGGYAGEPTAPGGGGYDPFAPQNYSGPLAPDYRGGYAGEQTVPGGGGFDPGRDIGTTAAPTKPDGTPINPLAVPTNLATGAAAVTTGAIPTSPFGTTEAATVIPSILSSTASPKAAGQKIGGYDLSNVIPNPLEQFASFSPLWTLAVLTKEQFNNPSSYRNSTADLVHVIFASAGRFDSQRQSTIYGTPEYYVNNFVMSSLVAPGSKNGNTNAFKFEFDIFEPYSMGLLLQSFQSSAINAGYANYIDNAPYVLRLDLQGYNNEGRIVETVKPKFFILRLTSIKFQVNESGSTYKVEAIPYNHGGFSDSVDATYKDLTLIPGAKGTVEEILNSGEQSLAAALNKVEEDLIRNERIRVKDEYIIAFPEKSSDFNRIAGAEQVTTGATANPNAVPKQVITGTTTPVQTDFLVNTIGSSDFGFDQGSGGNFPFKDENAVVDEATGIVVRDQMIIDPKKRTFQFSQGQKITHMINQIVLSSTYAKKAMDPNNIIDGFIKWWRIDVQIELLKYDDLVGDYARRYTFRVVPFLVHQSIFSNVNSAPIGYEKLATQICKKYEYIYTGQNTDVLKFDIDINSLFYRGIDPAIEGRSALNSDPNQGGAVEQNNKTTSMGEGQTPAAQLANTGRPRPIRNPSNLKAYSGGAGTASNTEQRVAESFHKAFTTGVDMISVNLEILGDTYWMVESGMGNYFSPTGSTTQITDDGTVNYEAGDVFVFLTFNTPADVNIDTGLYDFQTGNSSKTSPFGGIYRVTKCESQFADGTFKQKLTCLRMPTQLSDINDRSAPPAAIVPDKASSPAIEIGPDGTPNTSLSAYPNYNSGRP